MTTKEKVDRIDAIHREQARLAEKIVEQMRTVIPLLLDAGQKHSAQPLQESIFEYDALRQEGEEIIKSDPRSLMMALLDRVVGTRQVD